MNPKNSASMRAVVLTTLALAFLASAPASAQANRIAINAGGAAVSFAVEVADYVADAGFSASNTFATNRPIDRSYVEAAAPPEVYQSERYGNKFTLRSPVLAEGRVYLVRLHFAEIYWGVEGLGGTSNAVGKRKMDVTVGGRKFLSEFDIYKESGGANRAITREFETNSDSRGNIDIEFAASAGSIDSNTKVSGVEFIELGFSGQGGNVPQGATKGINVGGVAAGLFEADRLNSNSGIATTSLTVATSRAKVPAPQEIYQSERFGVDFVVRSPVLLEGREYLVRLHFAEIFWGVPSKSGNVDPLNRRKINVEINGQRVLTDFDIYREANGSNKAVVREFQAFSNGLGNIDTRITASTNSIDNFAKISGVEFIQIGP